MNARLIGMFAVLCFGWMVSSDAFLPPAHADWFRPLTWGEKKPATSSRQNKKPTGVVGGTKRAIAKTADVLTPWDNHKKQDNPHDGAGRFFRPDLARKNKQNDATWYRPATWFREEPHVEKPLTVTDWMSQDRPEFENR